MLNKIPATTFKTTSNGHISLKESRAMKLNLNEIWQNFFMSSDAIEAAWYTQVSAIIMNYVINAMNINHGRGQGYTYKEAYSRIALHTKTHRKTVERVLKIVEGAGVIERQGYNDNGSIIWKAGQWFWSYFERMQERKKIKQCGTSAQESKQPKKIPNEPREHIYELPPVNNSVNKSDHGSLGLQGGGTDDSRGVELTTPLYTNALDTKSLSTKQLIEATTSINNDHIKNEEQKTLDSPTEQQEPQASSETSLTESFFNQLTPSYQKESPYNKQHGIESLRKFAKEKGLPCNH